VVAIKENSVGAAPPQAATASATSGAEETAEGTKDVLIEETETVTGQAETLPFQSETSKLLRIVAHSLYTDKEVSPPGSRLRHSFSMSSSPFLSFLSVVQGFNLFSYTM
jgi:hypothetical protein